MFTLKNMSSWITELVLGRSDNIFVSSTHADVKQEGCRITLNDRYGFEPEGNRELKQ